MEIIDVTPEKLPSVRDKLLRFVSLHGDSRITKQAISWLKKVTAEDLTQQGNAIIAALDQGKLVGLLAISDYGRDEAIVVVHRETRQRGIGVALIDKLLTKVDKAYGRVALDNIPSLKMCLAIGLVGFKLFTGPTGKPTMWLGVGNWKREDVE